MGGVGVGGNWQQVTLGTNPEEAGRRFYLSGVGVGRNWRQVPLGTNPEEAGRRQPKKVPES